MIRPALTIPGRRALTNPRTTADSSRCTLDAGLGDRPAGVSPTPPRQAIQLSPLGADVGVGQSLGASGYTSGSAFGRAAAAEPPCGGGP